MPFQFGTFELDEATRELRLRGVAQPLQPRVFDVLLHLVRNRERLVSKEELLNEIWGDVIVTDSSIMRAISVLRGIFRDGDLPDAIQTSSRQGYRFVAPLGKAARPASAHPAGQAAHAAYDQGDWANALRHFQSIEKLDSLGAHDFELWARAALHLGQPHHAVAPLERAVAAHVQDADRVAAARAALTLTNVNLEARAVAVAKGWHCRAEAFLADEKTECREQALWLWLAARIAMFDGDLARSLKFSKSAEAMGRRLEDPEVEALGLVYRAHVELATGEIKAGLLHIDEAGAAALSGTITPWACGFVFCSVIWAYLDRGDIGRAGQWTDQFIRWSKAQSGYGYPGLCRLHRGEILCVQGKLNEAENEIRQARDLLAEGARYAEGDAMRVLGEIQLLRGEIDAADEAFQSAYELGWTPLPGWPLSKAARGKTEEALQMLDRGLTSPSWADGQRRGILLAHLVQISARAGLVDQARQALAQLEQAQDLRSTCGCGATYEQARAELAFAEGDFRTAVLALREGVAMWHESGSEINVAHLRLRLSEILHAAGSASEADVELKAAERAFGKMNAPAMVLRCQNLRETIGNLKTISSQNAR